MVKFIKYVIVPIVVVALLVVGIILSKSTEIATSSIGTGLFSSSIVSIIIWLFQIIETVDNQNKAKESLYNVIKNEFVIKLSMAQVFLFNEDGTLCDYLSDLSKEASKIYREKKNEDHIMLHLKRFIYPKTYLGYTQQLLGLLDYALNQNLISITDYSNLNMMFQDEITTSKLLEERKKNEAVGFFASFLDNMVRAIKNDRKLQVFSNIKIENNRFYIEEKKLTKKDKVLFNIFYRKENIKKKE